MSEGVGQRPGEIFRHLHNLVSLHIAEQVTILDELGHYVSHSVFRERFDQLGYEEAILTLLQGIVLLYAIYLALLSVICIRLCFDRDMHAGALVDGKPDRDPPFIEAARQLVLLELA